MMISEKIRDYTNWYSGTAQTRLRKHCEFESHILDYLNSGLEHWLWLTSLISLSSGEFDSHIR